MSIPPRRCRPCPRPLLRRGGFPYRRLRLQSSHRKVHLVTLQFPCGMIIDIDELIFGERDENSVRKDLTPTEKVALGRAIQEREEELSRERHIRAVTQNLPAVHSNGGTVTPLDKGKTRDRVGAHIGWSGKTSGVLFDSCLTCW